MIRTSAPEKEAKHTQKDSAFPSATYENLYLTGCPTLKRFLRYVRNHAVNAQNESDLIEEWQTAVQLRLSLEKDEAGLADNPQIIKMGREYEPLLIEFLKDPLIRNGFNTVPTEVAFVELDRLVVYQKHIDLTFAKRLEEQLGTAPSAEKIFQTCLPYDHPQPPVKWSRIHRNSFTFVSPSNDLRFLGVMPLESLHVRDYPPPGNLVGVVGLSVGFGSNFMNAIYSEKRLILNNGSHRAFALRRMGFTHAPCIIQHVASLHELDIVAASDIIDQSDYYLKNPRPSMLRDYFDPRLHKVMPVNRRLRQVVVRFEIEEHDVPAF